MKAKPLTLDKAPVPAHYEQDVVAWANEQARLIRTGQFDKLDREHVADEIEDVGKSEERELASRMAVLLAHLLKMDVLPERASASWGRTLREQRRRLRRRVTKSPSLRRMLDDPEWIEDIYSDAVTLAAKETGLDISSFPETCRWHLVDVIHAEE